MFIRNRTWTQVHSCNMYCIYWNVGWEMVAACAHPVSHHCHSNKSFSWGQASLWSYISVHGYVLTPWCKVLIVQLVKKFPAFHGTRRFITALTSVRHLSLSWARPIQSIYPQPTSWRYILILSTHLRLGLPSGLFPSGFPTKTLYTPSPHPYAPHAQPITIKHTFMK